MSGRRGATWLAAGLLLLLAGSVHATTWRELDPGEMARKADLVFVGTVASVAPIDKGGTPWTRVTFTVETALHGLDQLEDPASVSLDFLGGRIAGGEALTVSGMPGFERGERLLVMAYDKPYASPVVGFRQGLWRVTPAGMVDEDGRPLSVDEGGALTRAGPAAGLEGVVTALQDLLGAGGGAP